MSICFQYKDRYKEWRLNKKIHRDCDLPAIEFENGDKQWWINGKLHRENDLPAKCQQNSRYWYINGNLHRENDKPAIIFKNGDKFWYKHGQLHREHDRPAIDFSGVGQLWWIDGINVTVFRNKYVEARKLRAQKKIYFWIIKILYRPGSDSAKRLAESSWKQVCKK